MSVERCYAARAPESGPPLIQHGTLILQTHDVGWIITGVLTFIATATSIWLVNMHLQWYTNKGEQRHIVRLLFMVPIYATISFASYLFWNHSTPLLLIRDGYESTVLTAFFYLLLTYLSPDPDEQKSVFIKVGLSRHADREARNRGEPERKWLFPLGFVKWKPEDGLYFLQLMKWGVLQYVVIRPTTTLVAVILNYVGLYCEDSWQLRWGHIYITVIVSISVTIAMFCLLQLYVPISRHLAPHKPLLKLCAVKAVVFLTFWQATFLSILITFGVVKNTNYMTANDINIGIGALLETSEMMILAFLHIYAFTYKPYRPPYDPFSRSPPPTCTPRLRSLGHAMDFRETIREIWAACVYVVDRLRGREPTSDKGARRAAYLEEVFGRVRPTYGKGNSAKKTLRGLGTKEKHGQAIQVEVVERVDVDVEGERQWLGLGDDYGYGLAYARREKSDAFGEQIERELQIRGYGSESLGQNSIITGPDVRANPAHRRSWWRTIYHHISNDSETRSLTPAPSGQKSRHSVDPRSLLVETGYACDELPPPSAIRAYRSQHRNGGQSCNVPAGTDETTYVPSQPYQHLQHPTYRRDSVVSSIPRLQSPPPDSILGRIFPESTEHGPSTELGHDSTQSILYSSAHGHTPYQTRAARSTPRATLVPATPLILSQAHDSGITRYPCDIQGDAENLLPAMSAQIFGSPLTRSPPASALEDHVVEGSYSCSSPTGKFRVHHLASISASQITDPPLPPLPPSAAFPLVSGPMPLSRPSRLHRSSATSHNPSKRPRRSLPVPPLAQSTHSGPAAHTHRQPASRHFSSPLESIPQYSVPTPPSSSHNRTSRQNRHPVGATNRNGRTEMCASGSNRHSGRPGQGSHVGRRLVTGLVMPQPLSSRSPRFPVL